MSSDTTEEQRANVAEILTDGPIPGCRCRAVGNQERLDRIYYSEQEYGVTITVLDDDQGRVMARVLVVDARMLPDPQRMIVAILPNERVEEFRQMRSDIRRRRQGAAPVRARMQPPMGPAAYQRHMARRSAAGIQQQGEQQSQSSNDSADDQIEDPLVATWENPTLTVLCGKHYDRYEMAQISRNHSEWVPVSKQNYGVAFKNDGDAQLAAEQWDINRISEREE